MLVYRIAAVMLILSGMSAMKASAQTCGTMTYENKNQIDNGPFLVSIVRGIVKDFDNVVIPKACVGLFTDTDHKLIVAVETDDNGRFEIKTVPPGEYRLVAKCEGLCVANAPLRVRRTSNRRGKPLNVHMKPSGIDSCSYIDQK